MKRIEHRKCFGGWQDVYQHESKTLSCTLNFGIFLPEQSESKKLPVLYWLSGLTCNEQNFITKAGAQRYASEHGIILVIPDTSPRGEGVPNDDAYDLGIGAGFYLNATQSPWDKNFKMYDYIVKELPELIEANFPASDKKSIFGHSMGGHGALSIALKNPGSYKSVSAFSPIVAPTQVPWGEKAFKAYLGENKEAWKSYDTVELIKSATERLPLLVDQGLNDEFLETQLKPDLLKKICDDKKHPLTLNLREGYDHSYYFIASFVGDHIAHHAKALKA
jgi:S-formylglutathione hydrolase